LAIEPAVKRVERSILMNGGRRRLGVPASSRGLHFSRTESGGV
jgi:hypothetical protein